jgi:transcriptional regulator with XRE-family HTH domain
MQKNIVIIAFHSKIKTIRQSLGLTQEEFGSLILTKKSAVSEIEAGKRELTHKHIEILCMKVPNLNADWLREGVGEMFLTASEEQDNAASIAERGGLIASLQAKNDELVTKLEEKDKQMSAMLETLRITLQKLKQ